MSAALHERIAARRAIADQSISLAHLLGRHVLDDAGTRIGKVSDMVVRWEAGVPHPPVVTVLIGVGRGFGLVDLQDVTLTQTRVRLRSDRHTVARPVREEGHVALARDVLDRQLVDVAGVQVVRAADVYLLNGPRGWELAGVGRLHREGLGGLIREQFSARATFGAMALLLIANAGLTVSEFAGVGAAMQIFGVSPRISVPIAAVFVWALTVLGSYSRAERLFLLLRAHRNRFRRRLRNLQTAQMMRS